MTDDATGATDAELANKARNRDRVKRWQLRQQAKGRCRCGLRIAPGSKSRCLECLERRRLDQRRRRGIHTTRRRPRGRPVIGPMRARRQAFLDEEARRERARKRRLGLPVCPMSGRKRKREIQRVIKGWVEDEYQPPPWLWSVVTGRPQSEAPRWPQLARR